MKTHAVMFDLDGTLLNTLEDLGDAMNATCRGLDAPEHTYDFYRLSVGDGARALVKRSLPEAMRDDESIDSATLTMRQHYGENWNVKTRVYDGVHELIEALRERGIVTTVLSNKPESALQDCVRHFFPSSPFAAVRGVVPDGPLKPDPGGALAIIEEMGIPAAEWMYVGDTNTDMQTAVAAGLFAVGCTWGFRDREELLENGAEAIIDHPAELLALCDRKNGAV
jgi:phosphoglycolate phosphatase